MKHHFKYYLAGLFTGFIISLAIFFIFRDGQEKKSPQYPQNIEMTDISVAEEDKNKKKEPQSKPEQKPKKDTVSKKSTDSTQLDTSKVSDTVAKPDTNRKSLNKDTTEITKDSLNQGNDIVVMEDQLIDKQTVEINYSHPVDTQKSSKNLDSLLIDDQTSIQSNPDSMTIEFWKSPINYKGYRRIHNRLIIFGFTQRDSIEIFHLDDQLFMQIKEKKFPLNETNNFRSIYFNP